MKNQSSVKPVAAKIGQEFARLFRDGRGTIAAICDEEAAQIAAFLDDARVPIIKGLLPSLWEHTGGGCGCFVIGPNDKDVLRFTDDFARWHVDGKDAPGARAGVLPLMEYLSYGRTSTMRDLMPLLGVAAARVMLGQKQTSPRSNI